MKLRAILIIGLLTALMAAPALADKEYVMDTTYSQDQNGNPRAVSVHFEKAVESDTSDIFSPVNYPPDKYQFLTLYYSIANPANSSVFYEFNISVRDQANRYFTSNEFIYGDTIPANGRLTTRANHYAIYKNSTGLQLVWTDKEVNPPWEHYDTVFNLNLRDITPTPAATPVPTPTPTPAATPTPTPSSPVGQCLPFLPIGLILGGVGCAGWVSKKHKNGR